MPYIIGGLIIALLLGVYIVSFLTNKKTPVPEGLEERYNEAQTCSGCHAKQKMLVPEEVVIEFKEENSLWIYYMQH